MLAAIASPVNLVFAVIVASSMFWDLDNTSAGAKAPSVLGLMCILLGHVGSFVWIALRAWRLKKKLLLNDASNTV